MKKFLLPAVIISALFTACSATEDKSKMETNAVGVADSMMNAAPADTASEVKELSPDAEENR